jgi:diguanylate cyclase (GGDEF)-like protein
MMTASWRVMMTSWRLPKWPRRFAYPLAGLALSIAMVAGLIAVEASTAHQAPTISWIFSELRARPLPYVYLLVATLFMMTILGWIVGRKEDLLGRLSTTDPLTGLANRRRLRAAFADELNRAARYETPLSLLLVDLDRLKDINDRHGHADGDRALQLVAEALRRSCRATDLAARYGGDEFVVLAVNTPATEARVLALRIRDSVRRLSLRAGRWTKTSAPINHTVSIGAADLGAAALPTFDALHAAADRALYAAKAAGRDGVMVAPPRLRKGRRIHVEVGGAGFATAAQRSDLESADTGVFTRPDDR